MRKDHYQIIPELINNLFKEGVISERDMKELFSLREKILGKQLEITILRSEAAEKCCKILQNNGMAAIKLEDLKSKNGESFSVMSYPFYKKAKAGDNGSEREVAYFCGDLNGNPLCGWIKGEPDEEGYDNIGFLSGRKGKVYYCKICGNAVGEMVEMCS